MIEAGPAPLIFRVVEAYAAMGGVAAIAFLAFGLDRIDPSARGAYAFRPLLLPGLLLLWPLVVWRWRALSRGPARPASGRHYAGTHRVVWMALALLLPLLLFASLALRQSGPLEAAPVRLAAPAP
jgi:hypothetical protein